MKAAHSPLSSPDTRRNREQGLRIQQISFLTNGPYDLTLSPGQCLGVTGPSGIGKTQLLRAIADVIPHGGDCLLDARSCSSFAAPVWRKTVALVPAESFWWYDTVAPHFVVDLGQGKICEWLGRLGFPGDVGSWQVSRLSTGERQRLSLLRTLSLTPRVLLLDEPTSSLDQKMVRVVEEILAELCVKEGMMCLWVSHDREQLFRVGTRVFSLEQHGLVQELCS